MSTKNISPNDILEAWWERRPPGPIVLTWGVHRGRHAEWIEVLSVGRAVRRKFDPTEEGGAKVVASGPVPSCQALLATLTTVRPWSAAKNVPYDPSHVVTLTVRGPGVDWTGSWDVQDLQTRSDLRQLDDAFERVLGKAVRGAGPVGRPMRKKKAATGKTKLEGDAKEIVPVLLSGRYIAGLVVLGVLTAGLGALIVWFGSLRRIPRHCDSDGLMLRNGDHYPWSQLAFTTAEAGRKYRENGYDLRAADTTSIQLPQTAVRNLDDIIEFVSLHFPAR